MIDTVEQRLTPVDDSQREVFEFLSDPDTYTENKVDNVSVINTHCAHLFLCGDTVLKIKRAVAYTYLDMSTAEKREVLCRQEFAINHSVLPDIYRGVVAITREKDGALALDGAGSPIEWALHMHRFDEADVLDNVVKSGNLTDELSKSVGQSVAMYHRSLASAPVHDGASRINEIVNELIEEFDLLQSQFDHLKLHLFKMHGIALVKMHEKLLDQRSDNGFVKRCHGDLHLRNIVLQESVPVPFDALEFDDRLATIDVMYDLAFLLMDLDHRGLIGQKNFVLNSYLLHSDKDNISALALLPLFLFCRAGIKAMTSAQAAKTNTTSGTTADSEASDYLELALSYLDETPQMVVAIGGLSGSGKSTAALKLLQRMQTMKGVLLLRSDAERKAHLSIPETQHLPPEAYTPGASRENYEILFEKTRLALKAGYSVIVDAVFLTSDMRSAIGGLAESADIPFYGFWLEAPVDVLKQRIQSRTNDASDATVEVMLQQRQQVCDIGDWIEIDATDSAADTIGQFLL